MMRTADVFTADFQPQHDIGKRIRSARLRKGWTQLMLAEKSGVSRTTLFQLERGAIPSPRAVTLNRLACALNLPVSLLSARDEPDVAHSLAPDCESARFDRQTNPYVAIVAHQYPQVFAGFRDDDWDALYSSFGTGGALTEEGVLYRALNIARKRETLRRVSVLLETQLAEPTRAMVDSLFELIEVPTTRIPTSEPSASRPESCIAPGPGM